MARTRPPNPTPTKRVAKPPSSDKEHDDGTPPPDPPYLTSVHEEALNWLRIFEETIEYLGAQGKRGEEKLTELLRDINVPLTTHHLSAKPLNYKEPYPRPHSQYRTPCGQPPRPKAAEKSASMPTSIPDDQPTQDQIGSSSSSLTTSATISNPLKRRATDQQSTGLVKAKKSKAKKEKKIFFLLGSLNPDQKMGTPGQTRYFKISKRIMVENSKLVALLAQTLPSPEHNSIFVAKESRPSGHPVDADSIYLPALIKSRHITGHPKYAAAKGLLENETKFWGAFREWLLYVKRYGVGVEGQDGHLLVDSKDASLEEILLVAELFGAPTTTDISSSIGIRNDGLDPRDYF